jgi:ribosomal protein L37E
MNDASDSLPMVRCRRCGNDFYEVELAHGLCYDCELIERKKTKAERKRNDDQCRNDV